MDIRTQISSSSCLISTHDLLPENEQMDMPPDPVLRNALQAQGMASVSEYISSLGVHCGTNVFPVTSTRLFSEDGLVAKVFWAGESRTSEPDVLKKVYEIAEWNGDVKGHVPDMVCSQAFSDTSTAKIRERLGINTNGSRVLYVIVFRKLKPITALVGDEFLCTWWATVKCHLALWQNGIHHRDISPSNLMYRIVDGKAIGILNDFDLASIEDGLIDTEHTGTVPFMSLGLLDGPGLEGKIKHMYQHDAESFIWVLTWITVQYANGKLRAKDDRPLDSWLGVDAPTCCAKKAAFLLLKHWESIEGGLGHEQNYEVAKACLRSLLSTVSQDYAVLAVDTAFQKLLHDPVAPFLVEKNE